MSSNRHGGRVYVVRTVRATGPVRTADLLITKQRVGGKHRFLPITRKQVKGDTCGFVISRCSAGQKSAAQASAQGCAAARLLPELAIRHRQVVVDPNALYAGARLTERTLVPEDDARLGEIRFDDWLAQRRLEK